MIGTTASPYSSSDSSCVGIASRGLRRKLGTGKLIPLCTHTSVHSQYKLYHEWLGSEAIGELLLLYRPDPSSTISTTVSSACGRGTGLGLASPVSPSSSASDSPPPSFSVSVSSLPLPLLLHDGGGNCFPSTTQSSYTSVLSPHVQCSSHFVSCVGSIIAPATAAAPPPLPLLPPLLPLCASNRFGANSLDCCAAARTSLPPKADFTPPWVVQRPV